MKRLNLALFAAALVLWALTLGVNTYKAEERNRQQEAADFYNRNITRNKASLAFSAGIQAGLSLAAADHPELLPYGEVTVRTSQRLQEKFLEHYANTNP